MKKILIIVLTESVALIGIPEISARLKSGVGNVIGNSMGVGIAVILLELFLYFLLMIGSFYIVSVCPSIGKMSTGDKVIYTVLILFTGTVMLYPILSLADGGMLYSLMSKTHLYIFSSRSYDICRFMIPFVILLLSGIGKRKNHTN